MKYLQYFALLLLLSSLAGLAVFKPGRVFIPEFFSVTCTEDNICIDDPKQLNAALTLYKSSREYLLAQWGLVIDQPRIIFCHTDKCKNSFGLSHRAGYTVGNFAVVIAPRGWEEYYVAHELIHFWQADNFGSLTLFVSDKWITEGMAYALSNDPRERLAEPFEEYRQRFKEWHKRHAHVPLNDSIKVLLQKEN